MEEHLITFRTARDLKDKGFRYYSKYSYWLANLTSMTPGTEDHNGFTTDINYETFGRCYAPTQSLVQKWLREIHDINVLVNFETIDDSETAYTWHIKYYLEEGKNRKKDTWDFYEDIYSLSQEKIQWFDTYEQALENGLQEGLKLIKTANEQN